MNKKGCIDVVLDRFEMLTGMLGVIERDGWKITKNVK